MLMRGDIPGRYRASPRDHQEMIEVIDVGRFSREAFGIQWAKRQRIERIERNPETAEPPFHARRTV